MKQYLFRLIPPRPTFAFDMDEREKALMGEHQQYFAGLCQSGKVMLYGPVIDPQGPWGLAILEVEDDDAAQKIGTGDPTVIVGINTFEVLPMHVGMVRP
jgi:uncharacterized protein